MQAPATPYFSLVKRLGQRFESARRLFVSPEDVVESGYAAKVEAKERNVNAGIQNLTSANNAAYFFEMTRSGRSPNAQDIRGFDTDVTIAQ